MKQLVLKKTFELREKNKKVPRLDDILRDAIENQAKAKKKRAEHRAWLKTLPLEQQLDLMSIGHSLDTVEFYMVQEQLDKIQRESEAKQKAMSILERKVNYALRPVSGKLPVDKTQQNKVSKTEKDKPKAINMISQPRHSSFIESSSSSPETSRSLAGSDQDLDEIKNPRPLSVAQKLIM